MKRLLKIGIISLALCLSMVLLAGCESALSIGDEVEDGVTIAMTNNIGQDVTSIAIKDSEDENYPDALSQEENLENEASAELHAENLESADIKVTCADDTAYELHNINLSDVKDATLALEDDVAYLSYTSIESGEAVSTLEAEKEYIKAEEEAAKKAAEEAAAKKAAEEKAAKEAAAKKAAEEKAAQEAAAKKAAAQSQSSSSSSSSKSSSSNSSSSSSSSSSKSSGSSSSGSSSSGSGSSGSSSSGSSSSEEDCVDDIILNE